MIPVDHDGKYGNIYEARPHRLAWLGRLLLRQKTPVQIRLGLVLAYPGFLEKELWHNQSIFLVNKFSHDWIYQYHSVYLSV